MTMKRIRVALAGLGVLALVGGGTALAAKGGRHDRALADPRVKAAEAGVDRMHGHGADHDLDAAAAYLGTTASELIAQLRAGRTLADVAGSRTSDLIAALVAEKEQELAAAVTAGRLTQVQADAIVATLPQRVGDLVHGVRPAFGAHDGRGGRRA
jgi:hypothetical protein